MHEKPSEALGRTPRAPSSRHLLVADGEADAAGSPGPAPACPEPSTASRARGVRRWPGYSDNLARGEAGPFSLILDVGATVDATADDLVTFAVMGAAYARIISKNPNPSVALLSNGTEATKGPPRVVEAHAKLAVHPGIRFVGNVEGVDIPKGTADVICCDGFVGNVCLKMLEGVAETVVELANYVSSLQLRWKIGLAMLGATPKQLAT
jgi:glycerol-3-phosphate acyltransferase PlsX